MTVPAAILIFSGVVFLAVSSLGILRFPDFYSRTHAVGISETLGAMLLLGGLAAYHGLDNTGLKLLLILVFLFLTNPTATHIIAKAASRSGLQPWVRREEKEADAAAKEGKT